MPMGGFERLFLLTLVISIILQVLAQPALSISVKTETNIYLGDSRTNKKSY